MKDVPDRERQDLIDDLHIGRDALMKAIHGVAEDVAAIKPVSGWCILQCIEHVAVAEEYLLAQIDTAAHLLAPIDNPQREAAIRARGLDRTNRIQAPDVALPTGRFTSVADAMHHFLETRKRTMHFLDNFDGDLRAMLAHHPLIGQVNCYVWLASRTAA